MDGETCCILRIMSTKYMKSDLFILIEKRDGGRKVRVEKRCAKEAEVGVMCFDCGGRAPNADCFCP